MNGFRVEKYREWSCFEVTFLDFPRFKAKDVTKWDYPQDYYHSCPIMSGRSSPCIKKMDNRMVFICSTCYTPVPLKLRKIAQAYAMFKSISKKL